MKIKCTNCGADAHISTGRDFIQCPYCETALFVDIKQGISHYYFKTDMNDDDLEPVLRRRLIQAEILEEATITKSRLQYHPFWQFTNPAGKKEVFCAAHPPAEDIDDISAPAGQSEFYPEDLAKRNHVVSPEILYEEAVARIELELTPKELGLCLVHLPLFKVEYTCKEKQYTAWIGGVRGGEVFADDWPPNSEKKKDKILGIVAAAAFAAFFFEALVLPLWAIIPTYAVTAVAVFFAARGVLRKLGW
jgi:DNA-directed RNA polymerase subunit RPC12/RpoP